MPATLPDRPEESLRTYLARTGRVGKPRIGESDLRDRIDRSPPRAQDLT
jgi:hypothetical protein